MALSIKTEMLDKSTMDKIIRGFPRAGVKGFVRTNPGNCLLSPCYSDYMERIYNMELKSDDTFILSWIKSGTTWTQEMVWCIANNYNWEAAGNTTLDSRIPFLEEDVVIDDVKPRNEDGTVLFELLPTILATKSPRIFKSHLPLCLLPPKLLETCKVVVCLRNPKDVAVSYYHHYKLWISTYSYPAAGDFEEFANYFMDELLWYSPYWDYVLDVWSKRNHPNLCVNFFEDMKADLPAVVRKTANFLGKPATAEQIDALTDRLHFKNMKVNSLVNKEDKKEYWHENAGSFMRKGEVGNWKEYFSPELNEKMNKWIEEHLKGTDLKFNYEM